jgi:uncharacterized membrane protein
VATLDLPAARERGADGRRTRLLVGLAVLSLAPYVVGVLMPFYVNGLGGVPLADVSGGAHDPKDLWPHGPIGGLVQLAGLLSLAITPVGLVATLAGCVHAAITRAGEGRTRPRTGPALLVLLCVAALVLFFSPLGNALVSWRLD